jgi:hypothetical protein
VWADAFRAAFGGNIVRSLDIQQCAPDQLQHADLIVLSMPPDESHSQVSAVVHVLKECVHPVLFVPSSGIAERSSS